MSHEPIEGLPAEQVSADLARGAVDLQLDGTAYPLEALYGAAYIFIDRCYVLIDRMANAAGATGDRWRVTLSPKKGAADADMLRALAGEFANELLSCAWRHKITQENRAVIEQVTTQAIAGAMGSPSLDDLAQYDFAGEALEDPLGIAQSWEEKYKKKKQEKDGE
jgi:His-Xaa-Ser system protein HxsD